jgi:hypothetical protein
MTLLRARSALLVTAMTLVVPALTTLPARAASPTSLHVNFQPASVTVPAGYTADTGGAYNGTSGWQTLTGTALDITANSRVRHSAQSPDVRYDTLIQMQETAASTGVKTPARWVTALTNGTYNLTVAVGDDTATNSTYVINANGTPIIDHYIPTTAAPFSTQTRTVTVSTGQLILDPTGGSNTKIDFVDATPVTGGGGGGGGGTGSLSVTSTDTATLALSRPRLAFSKVRGFANPDPRSFTFTNSGPGTLSVTGLAISGANAGDFGLGSGQATAFTLAAGASATVTLVFHPADPTGCNTTASPYAIGNAGRTATLTWHTSDTAHPTGTADLGGIAGCGFGGNNEAVLDEILPALGYTTVVDRAGIDRRYIGPLRWLSGTDEVISPYFKAADSSKPVSLAPIAHYAGSSTTPHQSTGWYAQGAALPTDPATGCNAACNTLWQFPADPSKTTFNQNQKLLPTPTGTTTFTPTGTFGVFSGDLNSVNFTDDSLNVDHIKGSNPVANVPIPHYLHDIRVYPAYGPGHVAIPNTYIIGVDITRVSASHNNDYQDVLLLLRNATPALSYGPQPGAATTVNLTTCGSVSSTCAVTGFDGVLPNTAHDQCKAANLAFSSAGLKMTSTAGQLADDNQQNALYKSFDATKGQFTVTARVVGPVNYLSSGFQQVGAFFGPDQDNFVKVEAERNGSPHLTMFYRDKGVASTIGSVALPALTTASTLDLVIRGNTNVPDPLPYGDTYGVHGYPLGEVTVYYSLNGAGLVQVGTMKMPTDVTGWFSKQAKAGILTSNSGAASSITATFSKFAVTAP